MRQLSLALSVLGSAACVIAQNCNGAPAPQVFSNRAEFAASFYYNIGTHIFDLNAQVPITITGMRTWLYDSGAGNPPTQNQVGNTAVVDVYTCPTTRLGNETNAPTNPGSPWTLLGSGTITVVDTAVGNGESPTVFNPPLQLPAGAYGVNVVYNAPTTGQNPGPLHCLGVSPNPGGPYTDPFLTMTSDGIVATPWVGAGTASPNLRILYTPAASSAQYVPLGDGCYFRPHAFYESFPSPSVPDLANTSQSWLNMGPNYLVIPSALSYVTPTSPSLTLNPPGSTSSGLNNWDDALTTPIVLPFTFNYPGGSTTDITISSNGHVFLANVVNNSYGVCGASYGSIAPFRDNPARVAPLYVDLDPSPTGGGTMHYDVDPSNQFVRITWAAIPEWTPTGPGPLNTLQLTLYSNGNVDVLYGSLGMVSTAGNNAIAGFTPGNGARLPSPMDISASLPFSSGDGAIPPVLTMSGRPVFGTTPNIITKNITTGTFFQVFVAGLTGVPAPISLAAFGMPGCFQHINPFTAFLSGIGGNGEFAVPFAIPNNASYQNVQFFFQAAPLTPGLNAAGILTSNGLCAKVGT